MSLVNNQNNVEELKERTRLRNLTVWIALDHGGIMAPIQAEVNMQKELGGKFIEGYIAEQEEIFAVKEDQRDRAAELEQDKISQEQKIVDAEAANKRAILAVKLAGEQYVHSAQEFDSLVRAQIMAAKEYAAIVEREQIKIAALSAELDIAKAENRLKEITAEVYYEYVKRQETEVDVARAKVEAAKAQVRAVMAEVEVKEAEVALVEADLKEAMAEAEKVSLQADVASILAEIIVKGLSKVKFEVERDTIESGFTYIQSKLEDMLQIWSIRDRIEGLRAQTEEEIYESLLEYVESNKGAIDLKTTEMSFNEGLETYKEVQEYAELEKEKALTAARLAASEAYAQAKNLGEIQLSHKQAWAKKLVNKAQKETYNNHKIVRIDESKEDLYIDKG